VSLTSVRSIFSVVIFFALVSLLAGKGLAQPLTIGAKSIEVDSCLSKWSVTASSSNDGDSVCLGAKFWDLEGHLLFHIDSVEHKLTKVDWTTYMPVPRPTAEEIAKQLGARLGPCDRARNDKWVYWIWDNEEIHYMLGYGAGTLRLLEFEDQSALEACMLH